MDFITKEQFEKRLGNKSRIELDDLIQVIEEQFGYKVSISKKYTEEQKKKLTKTIFMNEDVLRQLDESEREPEGNDIGSYEAYTRFIKEVRNEQSCSLDTTGTQGARQALLVPKNFNFLAVPQHPTNMSQIIPHNPSPSKTQLNTYQS